MELNPDDFKKLAELLRPPEEEVPNEEPTSYEIEHTTSDQANPYTKLTQSNIKTIEEYEQQQEKEFEISTFDDRKEPEYTMRYRQAVTAEDVYLQIGPKSPATASCENLVVRIKLPGTTMQNVDLNVNKSSVDVKAPQYKLHLPLPHEIDPDSSKAAWETDTETLILTLKLDREFDFVNF